MLNQEEMKKMHDIIATIYSAKNTTVMRQQFNKKLLEIVDYDYAIFDIGKMKNSTTPYTTDPVVYSNFSKEREREFIYQYEKTYSAVDYVKWVFSNTESLVYRTTDLIEDSIRKKASFYINYLQAFDLDFAAGIVLIDNSNFLATLTIFKKQANGNFTDKDIYLLNQFMPHLENRFIIEEKAKQELMADESYLLKTQFDLTHREIEIMGYIYRGNKNEEIAQALHIAPTTVKKHITNIYSKMDITTRTELIKYIMNNELYNIWDDI